MVLQLLIGMCSRIQGDVQVHIPHGFDQDFEQ